LRLKIDVCEGDGVIISHSAYGAFFSWTLDKMRREGGFDPSDSIERWSELGRRVSKEFFEVDVPDADLPSMTVGELKKLCLAEARRVGAANPEPDQPIVDVWLSDPVLDERLSDRCRLSKLELTDGDLLVLYIEHPIQACYSLAPPRNPAELLHWLQLAENTIAPTAGPRLWGVLLYTQADVELATYVRTHFDDLNVLSGPATRVFVMEQRQDWSIAKKYWRRHMEPELYRVMSVMHWLRWTPYDPQGAYKIASMLDLSPEQLPCLVFFHSRQGPLHEGDKLIFRIEHTSTAYFRALFGGIAAALRPLPAHAQALEGDDGRPPWRESPTFRLRGKGWKNRGDQGADEVLRTLLCSARTADATAFEALREAQPTIRSAMQAAAPPLAGITISNSQVVLETAGAAMSENFYFQGENTTFINRPQDTVIRDFQNAHGMAVGADDLTRLLRLVLSSGNMTAADREEAAVAIHDLARIGSNPEPDTAAASTRLERLRALLSSSADIAQPALTLLASLAAFFTS
jgi:hypothetical protein